VIPTIAVSKLHRLGFLSEERLMKYCGYLVDFLLLADTIVRTTVHSLVGQNCFPVGHSGTSMKLAAFK
jgi:hypothetical protein